MSFDRISSLLIIAVAIVVCPACDDASESIGGVDTVRFNSLVFVEAPKVRAVGLPEPTCPGPVFVAPFDVVVNADSRSDLFLTGMQFRFVDDAGIPRPEHTITRAGLEDRFGSTRVGASESRHFPLEFPFECGAVPHGVLTVGVDLVDSHQRERQTSLVVRVE
jgi:hypothetical protein